MTITPGDVHVNQNLTNVSIAHFQSAENFVANRAGPPPPRRRYGRQGRHRTAPGRPRRAPRRHAVPGSA